MATTATPNRPRRSTRQARASVPARGAAAGRESARDSEYDLLTAALIGATIGAAITYMLRRGPSGQSPMRPIVMGVGRGAAWAGKQAASASADSARWAARSGKQLWKRVPREEIRENVTEYAGRARDAIDHAVETEVRDLRRAIRRQRKRLGV